MLSICPVLSPKIQSSRPSTWAILNFSTKTLIVINSNRNKPKRKPSFLALFDFQYVKNKIKKTKIYPNAS